MPFETDLSNFDFFPLYAPTYNKIQNTQLVQDD